MVYVIGLTIVAILGTTLWRMRNAQHNAEVAEEKERERQRLERERDRTISTLIQEGSHMRLPDGAIVEKCQLCEARATHSAVRFERSLGLWAWVRERLGAPRGYQVGRAKFDAPTLCEVHMHLVHGHFHSKLLDLEQQRIRQVRDDELELQAFERGGALEELRAMTAEPRSKRRRGRKPKENVVPIRRAEG